MPEMDGDLRRVMDKHDKCARKIAALFLAALLAFAAPARGEDLQPESTKAFDHYVALTEARLDSELARREPYLWIEGLTQDRRAAAESQLRKGEVVIERLETLDHGKPIPIPGALIHYWVGTVFIPGATLAQTLALEEDYNHHQEYFRPDVMRSKILRHQGDDFLIEMRFFKKKVISAVLDTEHEVHYSFVDSTRSWSRSHTTRIQEIENAGEPDERLKPEGHDNGFLWRMNTYWRFEEKDGGMYVECRSISLTRDIPTGLGWLAGPFVNSIPRESLTFTLATTRRVVLEKTASGVKTPR
jgi:hypothetical protein